MQLVITNDLVYFISHGLELLAASILVYVTIFAVRKLHLQNQIHAQITTALARVSIPIDFLNENLIPIWNNYDNEPMFRGVRLKVGVPCYKSAFNKDHICDYCPCKIAMEEQKTVISVVNVNGRHFKVIAIPTSVPIKGCLHIAVELTDLIGQIDNLEYALQHLANGLLIIEREALVEHIFGSGPLLSENFTLLKGAQIDKLLPPKLLEVCKEQKAKINGMKKVEFETTYAGTTLLITCEKLNELTNRFIWTVREKD